MRETRSPIWPVIGMVVCLFAMTLMAARSWQRSAGELAGHRGATITADSTSACAVGAESTPVATQQPPALPPPARIQDITEFTVPRRTSRPSPPVADRIKLDQSVAETPSFPTVEPRLRGGLPNGSSPLKREVPLPAMENSPAILARQSAQQIPDIVTPWPYPMALLASLEPLQERPILGDWPGRVLAQLQSLHAAPSLGDPAAGQCLEELQRLTHEVMVSADDVPELNDRAAALRAAYALQRRLAIWQSVHQLAQPAAQQISLRDYDSLELTRKLQAIDQQLYRLENADAWRSYLLLDQLARLAAQKWSSDAGERSQIAREYLRRMESADATPEQAAFFAQPPWQEFSREMRHWVCEPVDYEALLDDLERLEATGSEAAAADFATHYQILRWSSLPAAEELGNRLNTYYRNANVRVAISGELLNRLLPHPETTEEDVNDMLLGGRVFGRSQVSTRLNLVLLPDRERWKLGLEASGLVDSQTETKRGPARFHNSGRSRYLARKLLLIDRRGIRSEDAEAAASANANLTGMETDLDGVPLVNLLVRAIARQQYDSQADDVKSHAEGLVANRAESRLDQEVDQKLSEATNTFRAKIWQPLHHLGLRPEAVDMQTTEDRLIARYRLAGHAQVAAFTPRPQAPTDSLLSVQIHESMFNNTVGCLDLGGREVALRELFLEVATKLQIQNYQVPDDVPEDVTIELAAQDPISFRCADDRIHLTLRIKKIAAGNGRVWRDFEVCGIYGPVVEGMRVAVARDSYIRLKGRNGRKLSSGDQVALRGIFAKVLAQQPDFDLLGNVLARDSRLRDLHVHQFVIRDGWVALAVGAGNPVKVHFADDSQPTLSR